MCGAGISARPAEGAAPAPHHGRHCRRVLQYATSAICRNGRTIVASVARKVEKELPEKKPAQAPSSPCSRSTLKMIWGSSRVRPHLSSLAPSAVLKRKPILIWSRGPIWTEHPRPRLRRVSRVLPVRPAAVAAAEAAEAAVAGPPNRHRQSPHSTKLPFQRAKMPRPSPSRSLPNQLPPSHCRLRPYPPHPCLPLKMRRLRLQCRARTHRKLLQ